ncbi:hypothetical protein HK097_008413 [Rhizophlyctis rosea]|uniref:Uncharacterized protein n=1 Tax=Rhizophlyctis rosea TaxID=64517 RepID=A0AAD5SAE3_9FUNG|nr:hypothetical protein HK097_008413 [Rhizophlyctis rosea]
MSLIKQKDHKGQARELQAARPNTSRSRQDYEQQDIISLRARVEEGMHPTLNPFSAHMSSGWASHCLPTVPLTMLARASSAAEKQKLERLEKECMVLRVEQDGLQTEIVRLRNYLLDMDESRPSLRFEQAKCRLEAEISLREWETAITVARIESNMLMELWNALDSAEKLADKIGMAQKVFHDVSTEGMSSARAQERTSEYDIDLVLFLTSREGKPEQWGIESTRDKQETLPEGNDQHTILRERLRESDKRVMELEIACENEECYIDEMNMLNMFI